VKAVVQTVDGTFAIDVETEEVEPTELEVGEPAPTPALPRVIAGDAVAATVVAVVDARPPLLISYDGGTTWRAAGGGLPPGRAVAIFDENPDVMVYASRNRLHVSENGGVFWRALAAELPEIEAVGITEA
jgi:hypothetical protein